MSPKRDLSSDKARRWGGSLLAVEGFVTIMLILAGLLFAGWAWFNGAEQAAPQPQTPAKAGTTTELIDPQSGR